MVEAYEIYNEKFKEIEGYLYYNTETSMFSMRILEDYSGKTPDWFFIEAHKRGMIDIPQYLVDMWVEGRVIPPNRQGLSGILEEIRMERYDVHDLLVYGNGRCQMDYSCIRRI